MLIYLFFLIHYNNIKYTYTIITELIIIIKKNDFDLTINKTTAFKSSCVGGQMLYIEKLHNNIITRKFKLNNL